MTKLEINTQIIYWNKNWLTFFNQCLELYCIQLGNGKSEILIIIIIITIILDTDANVINQYF